MKRDFADLLTLTTDISSRLAVIGEMLEDGIVSWMDGKASHKLLRALNVTVMWCPHVEKGAQHV